MPSPFDYVKSYSDKSKDLMESEHDVKEYTPYIVNKALSFMTDTVHFANEMNKNSHLDKDMVHAFYWNGIPKGKRFGAWQKKSVTTTCINNIMAFYGVNEKVAESYITLLNEDQLNRINELMNQGGKNDRKSSRGTS